MLHAITQIKDCITTLILQPVTPAGEAKPVPSAMAMELQIAAMDLVEDVRVIPQTHKMWGSL